MSFFDWTSQLEVNVAQMDAQHKQILSLMNRLYDERATNAANPRLASTLTELGRVTAAHFSDEEAHMAAIGFPKLRSHAEIHRQLLDRFHEHVNAFKASGKLSDDFFTFLKQWLVAHIIGIDKQYGAVARPAASKR